MMQRTISQLFTDPDLRALFERAADLDIVRPADLFLIKKFLYDQRKEPGAGRLFGPLPDRRESDAMALLFLGLFIARSQGSLTMPLLSAAKFASYLKDVLEFELTDTLKSISKKSMQILNQGHECLGQPGEFRPLIVHRYAGTDFIYFQRYHLARSLIARRIAELGARPSRSLPAADRMQAVLGSFPYTDRQKQACLTAFSSSLGLISGGPGSGKTTVIRGLLGLLRASGFGPADIAIAAPTARAADRIRETLGAEEGNADISCSTVQRLLGFRRNGYMFHAGFPLRQKHIIIDETSMLDVIVLADLLSAVDPGTTALTFLGDPNQLPSVLAGTVLSDLMEPGGVEGLDAIVLEGSHRSKTGIVELARWVQDGATRKRPEAAEVHFLSGMKLKEAVQTYLEEHWGEPWLDTIVELSGLSTAEALESDGMASLFQILHDNRILTLTHQGPSGVDKINTLCRHWVGNRLQGRMRYVSGFPVMMLRNDYALELYNGDPGILLYLGGQEQIVFQQEKGFRSLPAQDLIQYSLAFAHTVHKSQGSEYETVLFCLPEQKVRNLQRDLVYTAITRARNKLSIHGPPEMLELAARIRTSRQSGPPLSAFTKTG
ncbi:MAG: AAA family ATPase [Spirochaetales bacterium]|nr:AAA family ATPase [Spirochaetales bacterium]